MPLPAGLSDPKHEFQALQWRASTLARELAQRSPRGSAPHGRAVVDLGISAFIPHGLKGTSRKFVSGLGRFNGAQMASEQHAAVDGILREARAAASRVSLVGPSLGAEGNSNSVLKRLGASLDSGSPASRAGKLDRALSSLAASETVCTTDIPRYLEWRALVKRRRTLIRQEPDLVQFLRGLPETVDIRGLEVQVKAMAPVPSVGEPLQGALARLNDSGPDSYRQGINSLRVALDALIEHLGGKGDWKVVGRRLVVNDEEWKLVGSLHHLLSRGSHAGAKHDRAELVLAMQLFVAVTPRLVTREPVGPCSA